MYKLMKIEFGKYIDMYWWYYQIYLIHTFNHQKHLLIFWTQVTHCKLQLLVTFLTLHLACFRSFFGQRPRAETKTYNYTDKKWEQHTVLYSIWGFPKMVVPNNHGFSY